MFDDHNPNSYSKISESTNIVEEVNNAFSKDNRTMKNMGTARVFSDQDIEFKQQLKESESLENINELELTPENPGTTEYEKSLFEEIRREKAIADRQYNSDLDILREQLIAFTAADLGIKDSIDSKLDKVIQLLEKRNFNPIKQLLMDCAQFCLENKGSQYFGTLLLDFTDSICEQSKSLPLNNSGIVARKISNAIREFAESYSDSDSIELDFNNLVRSFTMGIVDDKADKLEFDTQD